MHFFDKMRPLYAIHEIHLPRRFWHIGTGLFGLAIYGIFSISQKDMGIGLLLLSLTAFFVEFLRFRSPFLNEQIIRRMGVFMRDTEVDGYSGFPFYSLGCALSLLLFEENIAHLSLCFLIFIDPVAGCFGIRFGRNKNFFGKSFQGFFAGLVVGSLTTWIYGCFVLGKSGDGQLFVFSLCAGLLGACAELFSFFLDDNLTIPFLSGLGLTVLNQYLTIL